VPSAAKSTTPKSAVTPKSSVVKAPAAKSSPRKQPRRRETLSLEQLIDLLQRYRKVRSFSELYLQLRKDNPEALHRLLELLVVLARPATPVITSPGPGATFTGGTTINVLVNCSQPDLPHELAVFSADEGDPFPTIWPINDPDNPSTCPHGSTLQAGVNVPVDLPAVAVTTDYYIVIRITSDVGIDYHYTHRILITVTP
jgi:hypothetical protein